MNAKGIIGVIVFLGIIFLLSKLFDKSYDFEKTIKDETGTVNSIENKKEQLPLDCVIEIKSSFKKTGSSIPNLFPGGSSFGPLTPIGTTVYQELPSVARKYFKSVRVVTDAGLVTSGDVVIKVKKCEVLQNLSDTDFRIRGLQLAFGYVNMKAAVELEIEVSMPDSSNIELTTVGRSNPIGKTVISPLLQFRKMMSKQLDEAVQNACLRTIKNIKTKATSPVTEKVAAKPVVTLKPTPTKPAADGYTIGTKVLIKTSLGDITVGLYEEKSPITTKNYLGYVNSGFYNSTIFHRVIKGFMIQGGGLSADMAKKETMRPIMNETTNKVRNKRGTLAMARTNDINSATSQFFINLKDNISLDFDGSYKGYAVFGEVLDGMDVVDVIAAVATGRNGMHDDVPIEPVVIESATIVGE